MSEATAAIEKLHKAFADFREANDKALAEKAETGAVNALLQEQVDKLNAAVTAAEDKVRQRVDALERRMETEGAYGEHGCGARISDEKIAAEFSKQLGAQVESAATYRAAIDAYLRNGPGRLPHELQAALSVGSSPAGGYFVMPDSGGRIVRKTFESSPMRSIAAQQTISTDALEGLTDNEEAGTGWVGETSTRSETTTPEVGKYRIDVHEQYAEPKATQKLLDDAAVDVGAWLEGKIADKFSRTENTAFVLGNGVGRPRGFLARPVAETADASRAWGTLEIVKSGANGAFASSNPGDALITLLYALKATYRQNAVFVMARSTVAAVRKLKDGDGNYLWQPNFQADRGPTLIGHRIVELEDMPVLATDSLSLAVGDFMAGYQIVDRIGIRVLRDPFTQKGYVKFYATKRVGGDVIDSEAIKIMKFAA